jgi:eukaryotic-like serine/threonine-protein kinase
VITLTLLHPVQSTPIQTWNFPKEAVVRIGRAADNQVVLYSAVVSRYHVELQIADAAWRVINLGTNGTYISGKRIDQQTAEDGMVIRLARSGPMIQIRLNQQIIEVPHKSSKEAFESAQQNLQPSQQ